MKKIAIIHFKRTREKVVKIVGNQIRRGGNMVIYINPLVIWEDVEEQPEPSYSYYQILSQIQAFIIVADEDALNIGVSDLKWLSSLIIAHRRTKKFAILTFTKHIKWLPDIGSAFKSLIHDCGNFEEPVFSLLRGLKLSNRKNMNNPILLKEITVFLSDLYSKF
jgi:hypothetical protein